MSLDINTLIQNNFTDNILYFQTHQPDIFNKISEFEMAVENGFYELKYELIYEEGAFDVVELPTQTLLYEQDTPNFIKKALQSINYFQEPKLPIIADTSSTLLEYISKNLSLGKAVAHIDKYIFFGLGLALHVEATHEQIAAKAYLFVEENIELFRLSMFCVNYKTLAQEARLFFSVFEEKNRYMQKVQSFLEYKHYYNHSLQFFEMENFNQTKKEQFELLFSTQRTPPYKQQLQNYLATLQNIFQGYKFLTKSSTLSSEIFDEIPFLLIDNGSSLEQHSQWLEQHHQDFIIVSSPDAISFLQKKDIHVDIIISLKGEEMGHFEKSLYFCPATTPMSILEHLDRENIFLVEDATEYKQDSLKVNAPSSASLGYELLLLLGAKKIYLLGYDMSVKSPDTTDERVFEIDGNFTSKLSTTQTLFNSLQSINNASRMFKKESQKVYNLSNGVRIQGAFALKTEDVTLQTRALSFESLSIQVNKNISQTLSFEEKEEFEKKLQSAKENKESIILLANKEFVTKELFLDALENIYDSFLAKNDELAQILANYLLNVLESIFTFFNTQDMDDERLHVQQISTLLSSSLITLSDEYLSKLTEEL